MLTEKWSSSSSRVAMFDILYCVAENLHSLSVDVNCVRAEKISRFYEMRFLQLLKRRPKRSPARKQMFNGEVQSPFSYGQYVAKWCQN